MTAFAAALANLDPSSPRANIESIKNAVASQLRANDPRVIVKTTDHFNHTFVPDIILSWASEKDVRRVFLRTSFYSSELVQDLAVLGGDHPIILSLDHIPPGNSQGLIVDSDRPEVSEELTAATQSSRTLVTDPYGLNALEVEADSAPVVNILNRAVLQGGRGLVGETTARQAGQRVSAGFGAARTHDVETTEVAVQQSEAILDVRHAARVTRLLQAVWVGSGASGASFPGPVDVGSSLDEASLRFLLALPDISDPEFWRRIGADLSLERLCSLVNLEASPNLRELIRTSGYRLQSKACRVKRTDDSTNEPTWSIEGGLLRLVVGNQSAFFAPSRTAELPAEDTEPPSVVVTNVRERAAQTGALVEGIELATDARQMAYGSIGHADVSQDSQLGSLESALGPLASVRAVNVQLSSTRSLRCDFRSRTAAGRSNSKYQLAELVQTAIPLMTPLNGPTFDQISQLIDPGPDVLQVAADVDEPRTTERSPDISDEAGDSSAASADPTS